MMTKMNSLFVALSLAALGASAQAAPVWTGTADYTQAPSSASDEDLVGAFDTYDFSLGPVLLTPTGTVGNTTFYNGYFQAYTSLHTLMGDIVSAPGLNSNYEVTVVADFQEAVTTTQIAPGVFVNTAVVSGGSFKVYFDTTPDYSFSADSGFSNGDAILVGNIVSGGGTAIPLPTGLVGVNQLNFSITSYDQNIFSPDTITDGNGLFTIRLGDPSDAPLLSTITSVQGNSVAGSGNLLMAADGYMTLAVPEPEVWAMLLAGVGLVGLQLRRKGAASGKVSLS